MNASTQAVMSEVSSALSMKLMISHSVSRGPGTHTPTSREVPRTSGPDFQRFGILSE